MARERSSTEFAPPGDKSAADLAALLEKPLTAESAAGMTLLRNPEVAAGLAELGVSRADLVEAGTLPNPNLGAMARFGLGDASGTMVDLDGGFPLLDALMLPLRRKLEAQHFERAKLQTADRVLGKITETRVAWYEAVAAQLEREILADAREAASAAADLARAQYDAGNLSRLERLGHESLAVHARLEARAAETESLAREQALRRAIGLRPGDPEWFLMPALPPAAGAATDPAALVETALRRRLDLAAADAQIEAMRHALKLTKRFRFTGLFDVGVSAEREFDGEWSLGPSVEFELPLFDRKRGAVMRFESLLALAQAERDAIEADIRAEVLTLAARLAETAESAAAYRNELLPLHRDLVAETQLHYNGMLVGVYELLNAKRDELEAQRGAVHALLEYWRSRAELERAIAGPVPTAETPVTEEPPAAPAPADAAHEEHHHHEEK